MTLTFEQVRDGALALDIGQRQDLIDCLVDQTDSPDLGTDHLTDDEFHRELDRRADEARRDPSVMIPWKESMRQIRESFQ